MIKAFVGAIAALMAATGLAARTAGTSVSVAPRPEGTNSTPAAFALPQLGTASIACGRRWAIQPRFDTGLSLATEAVTIRAGAIVRRNYTYKIVGRVHGKPLAEEQVSQAQQLALPFGHYRTVTFTVRQGTEPRTIDATLTAEIVAGTFTVRGVPERLAACFVKRWSVAMNVSPN